MIKLKSLLLVPLMTSCVNFSSYQELFVPINDLIIGNKQLSFSDSFYQNQDYSFASFQMGRSEPIMLVLWKVSDYKHYWVDSQENVIVTMKGKIIQTIGLNHDLSHQAFNPPTYPLESSIKTVGLLNFYSPEALGISFNNVIEIHQVQTIDYLSKDIKTNIYRETVDISNVRFKSINYYYYSNILGYVVKSTQKIHPFLPEIKMTFYYK